jgi:LacI family transcriptional regulator
MGSSRPTIRDVARAAGVSVMTVSRVANGQDGVSQQTAARVRQVIKTLGYQRNELADQLRRGRSTAILGLVVDDISNPFYATLARAVEEEAHRRGYLVLAGSTNEEPGREHQLIASLCERRVGGFIVVPVSAPHDLLRTQRDMGTPLVVVDRQSDGLDADAVLIDNHEGAGQAIGHLARQDHTRIAYLGNDDRVWTARQRHEGYRRALGQAGIGYDTALVRQGLRHAELAEAATRALLGLPDPPTALFCANNVITTGAIRALSGRTHDIAVVGFDDFPLAELLDPPVTVLAHDPGKLGTLAAQLLFARMDGDCSPPRQVILHPQLIPRGSGEIPPRPAAGRR